MMQNTQQLQYFKQYGRIYPLRWGYYANPQMCMFGFTLLLTVTFSLVMIYFVFLGFYHKIIGSLLCCYVIYRYVSLAFSSPGLAVQSIDERFHNDFQNNNQLKIQSTELQYSLPESHKQDETYANNYSIGSTQVSFKDIGFYGYCNDCRVPIQHRTRHCKTCRTCIDGFDHHCIWIGKCIGRKNMWQFKEFICFIFVTLIYALILSIQSAGGVQKIG